MGEIAVKNRKVKYALKEGVKQVAARRLGRRRLLPDQSLIVLLRSSCASARIELLQRIHLLRCAALASQV